MIKTRDFFLAAVAFFVLTTLYLYPGQKTLFQEGITVGLGTDDLSLPYFHFWVNQLFKLAPISLFNGTLFAPNIGFPTGSLIWISFFERPIILFYTLFFTPYQTPYLLSLTILVLNGLIGFYLGKKLKFDFYQAILLGIMIAFTPYTVTRSMVHQSLAATFGFTCVLIAAIEINESTKKAASWLVIAGLSAHYYLVVILTLLPFYFFIVRQTEIKKIILSVLPLLMLLLWVKQITPLGVDKIRYDAPLFKDALSSEDKKNRDWDVLVYSARPLDYISGNYVRPGFDINPIRSSYTEGVLKNDPNLYIQERSSGIRWLLIIFSIIGFIKRKKIKNKKIFYTALGFAFWCYLFSLSPRAVSPFGVGIAPSRWVHEFFPEMRAPNRWSPGVNLGLAVAGLIALFNLKNHRIKFFISILCILEFLPAFNFPVRQVDLVTSVPKQGCGQGIMLPYFTTDSLETYKWVANLSGSDCKVMNHHQTARISKYFNTKFLDTGSIIQHQEILNCLNLDWAYLHPSIQKQMSCKNLGLNEIKAGWCIFDQKNRTTGDWKKCLPSALFQ